MKLWVQDIRHSSEETPRVVPQMLKDAGAKIVRYQTEADYGIVGHIFEVVSALEDPRRFSLSPFPLPDARVVACYEEPPLYYHMKYYDAHANYLEWFSLPPINNCKLLTLDPAVFPYPPFTKWDRTRSDTRLHNRGVFYRGNKRDSIPSGERYGRVDLDDIRVDLIQKLVDSCLPIDLMGLKWTTTNTYGGNDGICGGGRWQEAKRAEWAASTADFHLCAENSHVDNYVSEKIHHGFQSDLVVLYLGNRRIEEYIPKEAFINLNRYCDPVSGRVDVDAVVERLRTITQEEYDSILYAARAWRRSGLEERHEAARVRLTQLIIDRFKEVGAL